MQLIKKHMKHFEEIVTKTTTTVETHITGVKKVNTDIRHLEETI